MCTARGDEAGAAAIPRRCVAAIAGRINRLTRVCADHALTNPSEDLTPMFATLIKLMQNEDGATATEYGLIAALIAVAAVTVMGTVGTALSSTFNNIATKL